jgi:hypothetical protein
MKTDRTRSSTMQNKPQNTRNTRKEGKQETGASATYVATIRGYSGIKLLILDEAARVPDDIYRAVRPMLAVSAGHAALLRRAGG